MKQKNTRYALLACSALFSLSVATGASAAAVTDSCVSCHGVDGANSTADVPNIGGYSATYITASLKSFKKKERPCVVATVETGAKKGTKTDMCQVANGMSDADVKQVSDFFAGKPFVRTANAFDAAKAAQGKTHFKSCDGCHSEGGSVPDDDAGILAGQKTAYIAEQIKLFQGGKRPIPKKMKAKLDLMDATAIDQIINYLASEK